MPKFADREETESYIGKQFMIDQSLRPLNHVFHVEGKKKMAENKHEFPDRTMSFCTENTSEVIKGSSDC